MTEHELPTWPEMIRKALEELDGSRGGLSGARDWLGSDWRPLGSSLPPGGGDARRRALQLIGDAKTLVDEAESVLRDALDQ